MSSDICDSNITRSIQEIIAEFNLKNYCIDIQAHDAKGESYLGLFKKVVIKGENESGTKEICLIVKIIPNESEIERAAVLPLNAVYETECSFYSSLLEDFKKLQENANIQNKFTAFVKCYKTKLDCHKKYLIMEDLFEKGFKVPDRLKPFDYAHLHILLQELGKFHALSYALRENNRDLFERYANMFRDKFITHVFSFTEEQQGAEFKFAEIETLLEEFPEAQERFRNCRGSLITIMSRMLIEAHKDSLAVICHGDIWPANTMFRYEENLEPKAICFIDWQLCRLANPATDLSYVLFMTADKNVLEESYYTLLKVYHENLTRTLAEFGLNAEKILSFDRLIEEYRKHAIFGLSEAGCLLKRMLSKPNKEEHESSCAEFERRIIDVIFHCIKIGAI